MTNKDNTQYFGSNVSKDTLGEQILYIVGNGFDLHHGIRSSYYAFGAYLKAVDGATYDELERYFSVDEQFWGEFEAQLANLDTDSLLDDASTFLAGYGDEDWSDSGHHDYEFELTRVVKAISSTLRQRFAEWVRQIAIPTPTEVATKLLPIRKDARYLTFNYTDTLQRVYGIAESNVFHIHGAAGRINDRLVLGHGWKRGLVDSLNFGADPESMDTRVMNGNEIVDNYFTETFKPTASVIEENQPFFQSLQGLKKIYIMGHSLSNVDLPYLEELCRHIDAKDVQWQVSFHENSSDAEASMHSIGVNSEKVLFVPLTKPNMWVCT
ncbi:bacteriophage abortive infection AbiH family protein [Comamonas sp. E6]|uniref:bacteriophage abortive infection AbiH family protein n=1 Tax=Comamonas sp. E6 TaxID=364029 RepID=UPI000631D39E|nr:bacteriophage abortive infection AbiH family protein [Comamonas sp. E6]GAO72883.1 hypothetical protein CSE6_027_43200 [Comamonas sp. E6]